MKLQSTALRGIPSATSAASPSNLMIEAKVRLAIDWSQLYQLSEGNQEFELELIKLFFVESKTILSALGEAILDQDVIRVEQLAHKIKGSSGNMGFRLMSSIAGDLELQARQRKLDRAPGLVQELTQWIVKIQQFLE